MGNQTWLMRGCILDFLCVLRRVSGVECLGGRRRRIWRGVRASSRVSRLDLRITVAILVFCKKIFTSQDLETESDNWMFSWNGREMISATASTTRNACRKTGCRFKSSFYFQGFWIRGHGGTRLELELELELAETNFDLGALTNCTAFKLQLHVFKCKCSGSVVILSLNVSKKEIPRMVFMPGTEQRTQPQTH